MLKSSAWIFTPPVKSPACHGPVFQLSSVTRDCTICASLALTNQDAVAFSRIQELHISTVSDVDRQLTENMRPRHVYSVALYSRLSDFCTHAAWRAEIVDLVTVCSTVICLQQ